MTDYTIEEKVADSLAAIDEWNEEALDDMEVKLADMGMTDEMIAAAIALMREQIAVERAKAEAGYRKYLEGGCRDVIH
jgi:hypothetical protein